MPYRISELCLSYPYLTMPRPQQDLFSKGHVQFYKEDWEEMVQSFEQSLVKFYQALEQCKVMCDGPMRYSSGGGLPQTMSQLFLAMSECRIDCIKKLGMFRHNRGEDFFGSYFHYLQQGYYFCEAHSDYDITYLPAFYSVFSVLLVDTCLSKLFALQ